MQFKLQSEFSPTGDQPTAIKQLVKGLNNGDNFQTLLGVTGSGKTFTIANVINEVNRPTLVLSHNKTLAAQLFSEFKQFFPENAVEYFVSYYDYYQPEAYMPSSGTYIEKDLSINEEIEKYRLNTTSTLLSGRKDVIVVSSVSCIYGIGPVDSYSKMSFEIKKGQKINRLNIMRKLVELMYKRRDMDFRRGSFRAKGDVLEIFPSHYEDCSWRISMFGNDIESITEIDPLTGEKLNELDHWIIAKINNFIIIITKKTN